MEMPRENPEHFSPRRIKLGLACQGGSRAELMLGLLLLVLSASLFAYGSTAKNHKNTRSTATTTTQANSPPSSVWTFEKDILMVVIYLARGLISIVKGILLLIFLRCTNQKSTWLLSAQLLFALVQINLTITCAILLIMRTTTIVVYFVAFDPFFLVFFIVFLWIAYAYKKEIKAPQNHNRNPELEAAQYALPEERTESERSGMKKASSHIVEKGVGLLVEGIIIGIKSV